jgi:hypothetical protein
LEQKEINQTWESEEWTSSNNAEPQKRGRMSCVDRLILNRTKSIDQAEFHHFAQNSSVRLPAPLSVFMHPQMIVPAGSNPQPATPWSVSSSASPVSRMKLARRRSLVW